MRKDPRITCIVRMRLTKLYSVHGLAKSTQKPYPKTPDYMSLRGEEIFFCEVINGSGMGYVSSPVIDDYLVAPIQGRFVHAVFAPVPQLFFCSGGQY